MGFTVNDRIAITYLYVITKPIPGMVSRVAGETIYIDIGDVDGHPVRFTFDKSHDCWRSQFGRIVTIEHTS